MKKLLPKLLCPLEERLVQHNNSKKEVQDKLQEIYLRLTKEATSLEEKINEELRESFNKKEELIFCVIENLIRNKEERENEN